jgi:hypothetical protein
LQAQIAPPPGGVEAKLLDVLKAVPVETVWTSRDLAIAAGVRRGSARSALQALICKLHVTYAWESGEITGFRLVVETDWKA